MDVNKGVNDICNLYLYSQDLHIESSECLVGYKFVFAVEVQIKWSDFLSCQNFVWEETWLSLFSLAVHLWEAFVFFFIN